jgi:hypothetical protein
MNTNTQTPNTQTPNTPTPQELQDAALQRLLEKLTQPDLLAVLIRMKDR